MCDLMWEPPFGANDNLGVYMLSESEVDKMLSELNENSSAPTGSSVGEGDQTFRDSPSDTLSVDGSSDDEELVAKQSGDCVVDPEEKLADPTYTECPCDHNEWDNVRAKKDCITLRCRVCSAKWKTRSAALSRCKAFQNNTCSEDCDGVHIFRHKSNKKAEKKQQRTSKRDSPAGEPPATSAATPPRVPLQTPLQTPVHPLTQLKAAATRGKQGNTNRSRRGGDHAKKTTAPPQV
ncbi:hypothetical protein DIPPA_24771 [Diplonema papillatum]|nr:hypothetical protein DIPPA_24771 [Diplonema papillatum]